MAYTTYTEEEQKKQGSSGAATEDTTAAPAVQEAAAPAASGYTQTQQSGNGYNPQTDASYMSAMQALEQAKKGMPTYRNSYENQINDIYNQIVGREAFSYDVNADPLYQQYKQQYVDGGQMAMKHSMGQAAALTGGYGSSYGQAVGQQNYHAYLQQLNDVVPELYGMAYGQYQDEGDRLMNQYGLLGDMADDEYGKYQAAMDEYWQNISYLQGQADDAYDRGLQEWELAYAKQQDAYDRLADMIVQLGYQPTAEELAAAGMSDGQYQAWRDYYKSLHPTSSGGSGRGRGIGNGGDGDDDTTSNVGATSVQLPLIDYSNFGIQGIQNNVANAAAAAAAQKTQSTTSSSSNTGGSSGSSNSNKNNKNNKTNPTVEEILSKIMILPF